MARSPVNRRPTPPAETDGYSPAQTLRAQRRRGQPLVGEQTVFVDKYNGNFLTGIVIQPHWASHFDNPIWDVELIEGVRPSGVPIPAEECGGNVVCLTLEEWKAGMTRREADGDY